MKELCLSISVGLNNEAAFYRMPRNHAGTWGMPKSARIGQGSIVTLGPLREHRSPVNFQPETVPTRVFHQPCRHYSHFYT